MQLLRATWILFASHLGRIVLSRRALISLVVVALPVAAAVLVALIAEREGAAPALVIGWVMQVQLVVPLVSLIVGSAVVAEEIENRTVTYLFTRPIPRACVLLGRWLASLVLLLGLLAASSWAVTQILQTAAQGRAGSALEPELEARLLRTILLGGAVYSAAFAALGAILKRAIILGLAYTFVIEGFLANLPGGNQKITILYYLKSYLVDGDRTVIERLGQGLVSTELLPAGEALRTLLLILATALALGSWIVHRKQYVLAA